MSEENMNMLTFMKKAALWTAIVSAIAFVFVGIFSPIEPGMRVFGHIMKCVFGWAWVTVILETMMYTIGQIAFHWMKDYRKKYGKNYRIGNGKKDNKNVNKGHYKHCKRVSKNSAERRRTKRYHQLS